MTLFSRKNVAPAVSVLALLAVLVSMVGMTAYMNERETVQGFWRSRMAALSLSDRLRQTSDDLTRMVRLYAVNGEPVYREYFDEILAIRNGEAPRPVNYFTTPYWDIVLNSGERFGEPGPAIPIRTLANRAGMLEEENALLQQAEDASNALAVIENSIMDTIAGAIEAGGDYALEGETLAAMQRLHSQEYHGAKAEVMSSLAELGINVRATFGEARQRLIALSTSAMRDNIALLALTLAFVAADLWFQWRRKGLKLARGNLAGAIPLIAAALAFGLILVSLSLFTNFLRDQPAVSRTISERVAAREFSDSLRQTSDDLTRMARLYAITGEPRYREYFDEILDIRNGIEPRPAGYFDLPYWDIVLDSGERPGATGQTVAIRSLANNAGLSPAELARFAKAEDASNALAIIENEAMDVVDEALAAGGGDFVPEGETLEAMLRLHGAEYHAAKALVMQPLVELERLVQEQYDSWINGTIEFITWSLFTGYHAIIAAFLLLAVSIWQRRRQNGAVKSD